MKLLFQILVVSVSYFSSLNICWFDLLILWPSWFGGLPLLFILYSSLLKIKVWLFFLSKNLQLSIIPAIETLLFLMIVIYSISILQQRHLTLKVKLFVELHSFLFTYSPTHCFNYRLSKCKKPTSTILQINPLIL